MTLDEMEKLEKEATSGPWECKDSPEAPFDGEYRILGPYKTNFPESAITFDNRDWNGYVSNYNNAKFIAASREFVPWAIKRMRKLEALANIVKESQLVGFKTALKELENE